MKNTINKLQRLIVRLVVMIDDELEELKTTQPTTIIFKKNITELLGKLVTLIIQLNKLKKDESFSDVEILMPEEDRQIINRFLEKYKDK